MAKKKDPLQKSLDDITWKAAVLGAEFAFQMCESGHNLEQVISKLKEIFREESKSI